MWSPRQSRPPPPDGNASGSMSASGPKSMRSMTTCISAIPERLFAIPSRCIPSKLALRMTCGCVSPPRRACSIMSCDATPLSRPTCGRSSPRSLAWISAGKRLARSPMTNERRRRRASASGKNGVSRKRLAGSSRWMRNRGNLTHSTALPTARAPRRPPEPCRDAPRAASAGHLAAYSQLSRDISRPTASGGHWRCPGDEQSWRHSQTDAGARVGAAGDQGALRNHERTTRPPRHPWILEAMKEQVKWGTGGCPV